jgi:hypothetical protein
MSPTSDGMKKMNIFTVQVERINVLFNGKLIENEHKILLLKHINIILMNINV